MPPKKRGTYGTKDLEDLPISDPEDDPGEADRGRMPRTTARARDPAAQEGRASIEPGFTSTGPSGSSGGRALYGIGHTKKRDEEEEE